MPSVAVRHDLPIRYPQHLPHRYEATIRGPIDAPKSPHRPVLVVHMEASSSDVSKRSTDPTISAGWW